MQKSYLIGAPEDQIPTPALIVDVEVMEVREATPQEVEHGHVHAGGHDH